MASKGFQHNQIFKITSMKDRNVIEVIRSSSGIHPIVTKGRNDAISQKIKAVLIRPGEFRISSIEEPNKAQAWAFQPTQPLLVQCPWQDVQNQIFLAVEIYPNSKICYIKSKVNGWCLRNNGLGKQITVVPENRLDPYQHWKLDSTY